MDVVLPRVQNEKLRNRVWAKTPDELKVKWITETVPYVCCLNSIWSVIASSSCVLKSGGKAQGRARTVFGTNS